MMKSCSTDVIIARRVADNRIRGSGVEGWKKTSNINVTVGRRMILLSIILDGPSFTNQSIVQYSEIT